MSAPLPISSTLGPLIPYLSKRIFVWKQYAHYRSSSNQIFDLECILIWVVCWLVVVEHKVYRVALRADEDDFEGRVPEAVRRVRP